MSHPNNQDSQGMTFFIHKVLIEDASFETHKAPQVFQQKWAPTANIEVNTQAKQLDSQHYQITLTVTVTVENEKTTAFLVQLKQTGLFGIQEPEADKLAYLLNAYCPAILFPYARENISGLVSRGGFPELNIAPINFDALYAQSQKQTEDTTA